MSEYVDKFGILNSNHTSPIKFDNLAAYLNTSEALRKNAYVNILKFFSSKNENFQTENSYIFHISAQNVDRGYSLEPPR